MNRFALTIATLLACVAFAYAGPETIRSSSKEMKETVAPAPPACDFTWTGFYIGARGGGAWSDGTTEFRPLPNETTFGMRNRDLDADASGGFGGGELGFNWQLGRWFVLGVETDFVGGDISGSKVTDLIQPGGAIFPGGFLYTEEDWNWWGTFRGRVGFAPWCRVLIYGTGGLAYGNVDYRAATLRNSFYPESFDETNVGWTGGGGLEVALARHWTIKVEYLYVDLGDESRTANPIPANPPFQVRYNWDTQAHTVSGAINFKF